MMQGARTNSSAITIVLPLVAEYDIDVGIRWASGELQNGGITFTELDPVGRTALRGSSTSGEKEFGICQMSIRHLVVENFTTIRRK